MHATNKRHAIAGDDLRRQYVDAAWSMARLAAHYGLGQSTIRRWLADLGIGARPRGPLVDRRRAIAWSAELAYAVSVIATDGNLSSDGRHMSVTSQDRDLLETIRSCLGLTNAIMPTFNSAGQRYFRVQ